MKVLAVEVVSIGYPGPVAHGRPFAKPRHLGPGWVGFDFRRAFGHPARVMNDAAMQALGSYEGGRMLSLGLGTGLGTVMIADGILEPMELAHLPYKKGHGDDANAFRGGFRLWEGSGLRRRVARARVSRARHQPGRSGG